MEGEVRSRCGVHARRFRGEAFPRACSRDTRGMAGDLFCRWPTAGRSHPCGRVLRGAMCYHNRTCNTQVTLVYPVTIKEAKAKKIIENLKKKLCCLIISYVLLIIYNKQMRDIIAGVHYRTFVRKLNVF